MKKKLLGLFAVVLLIISFACSNDKTSKTKASAAPSSVEIADDDVLTTDVLTKEQQEQLTPQQVLDLLIEGNKEFTDDNLTVRNNSRRVRDAALGQYPKAAILSCLDSRVPVEDVFHRGIGDVFVARVAGNIVNEDMLGSLEYACKVSGSKLVLVLGHEHCGAVKSAIQDVKLGNITALLAKIRPAVTATEKSFEGEKTASNAKFIEAVCSENVYLTMNQIRKQSPILKEMEQKGEIMIVGGVYHMESGRVDFLAPR
ncbi:MAG: hypothetical protein RL662_2216 [Bacteroidota bacterium]|jgi:carbonic anhydrase